MAVLSTLSALGIPFLPLLRLLHVLVLLAPAAALVLPRQRPTEFVTPGDNTSNVCLRPAPWNQILGFFLTNYIARIATFKKTSGYEGFRDYGYTLASLFVPFVGISEAAATISRGSRWLGKDDVERALLAQALCVIVREPGWRPEDNEIIRGCIIGKGDDAKRKAEQRRRKRRRRKEEGRRKKRRHRSRSRSTGEMRDEKRRPRRGVVEMEPVHLDEDGYELQGYEGGYGPRRSRHSNLDVEMPVDDRRSRHSRHSKQSKHSRQSKRQHDHGDAYEPSRSRTHLDVETLDDQSSRRKNRPRRSRDPSVDTGLYSPVPEGGDDRANRYGISPDLYDTPPPVPAHLHDDVAHHTHKEDDYWEGDSLDDDYYSSETDDSFSANSATLIMSNPGVAVLTEPKKWKIQGYYSLPPTYTIAHLPPGTTLRPLSTSSAKKEEVTISNSYGVVKSFTGVIQIVSSLYALYSAYGDETVRYGYAAFGFSVLPYTIMSFMNTIANLVEASYDTLYLVRSDVMLEAERREHGEFIGEVAELVPASKATELEVAGVTTVDLRFRRRSGGRWSAAPVDEAGRPIPGAPTYRVAIPHDLATYDPAADPRDKILVQPVGQSYRFNYVKHKRAAKFQRATIWVITLMSLIIPYIVIGGISKFKRGQSTVKQRVFMMGWLVSGQTIGLFDLVGHGTKIRRKWPRWGMIETFVDNAIVVVGFALAVGGFVQVGSMLREFGYCIKL